MINTNDTLHAFYIEILQRIADGELTDKAEINKEILSVNACFVSAIEEWRKNARDELATEYNRKMTATGLHKQRAEFFANALLSKEDAMHEWALSFLETVKSQND